jgi:hypothetical protein
MVRGKAVDFRKIRKVWPGVEAVFYMPQHTVQALFI